ncbi:MAG: outer membrane beta-barrel protein [Bacteroidales bacterium]|nr:outer membrane beta-barrel protein [Bacteroidales bacterium]
MKIKLLLVLGLFVFSSAFAQVEKGNLGIVNSAYFGYVSMTSQPIYDGDSDSDEKTTTQQLSINPVIGYFVIDNLMIGMSVAYTTKKIKYDGEWSDPETSSIIAVSGDYFFGKNKAKPFLEAAIGYRTLSIGNKDEDAFSGLSFGGGAGLCYFINKNIGANIGFGYLISKLKNKSDKKFHYNNKDLSFRLGFIFTINTIKSNSKKNKNNSI